MIGEVALGGVYVPALLVLAVIAMGLTWLATRLLKLAGAYRFVAFRPLVELALFVLLFGLVSLLSGRAGFQP
jgi:hypothetical protein